MKRLYGGDGWEFARLDELDRSQFITDTVESVVEIIYETLKTEEDIDDWWNGRRPLVPAVEKARALENLNKHCVNCPKCSGLMTVIDDSSALILCGTAICILQDKLLADELSSLPSIKPLSKEIEDSLRFECEAKCQECGYVVMTVARLTR